MKKPVEPQPDLLLIRGRVYGMREEVEEYDRCEARVGRHAFCQTRAGSLVPTLKPDT